MYDQKEKIEELELKVAQLDKKMSERSIVVAILPRKEDEDEGEGELENLREENEKLRGLLIEFRDWHRKNQARPVNPNYVIQPHRSNPNPNRWIIDVGTSLLFLVLVMWLVNKVKELKKQQQ